MESPKTALQREATEGLLQAATFAAQCLGEENAMVQRVLALAQTLWVSTHATQGVALEAQLSDLCERLGDAQAAADAAAHLAATAACPGAQHASISGTVAQADVRVAARTLRNSELLAKLAQLHVEASTQAQAKAPTPALPLSG